MELKADTTKALYYYGLALKNHSKYFEQVKIHYDKLREKVSNEYVDLDYYYKIVAARTKIDTLIPPRGVLLTIGDHINTQFPEYGPYMNPSNSVLIFTSRRSDYAIVGGMDYEQNEDLYYSMPDYVYDGWTDAQRFTDEINSRYNEGSACLSSDARYLIFTRCNAPDALGICDLYSAEFVNGHWTNVKNLGPNVNSNAWDSHPSMAPDGSALFFSSNRGDGFGRCDIWVSYRQLNGAWGPAQNLGPDINTIDDEVSPFFHNINNTLYFSSKGHVNGFGGFDIYRARYFGDYWEEPKNLGPLVNTLRDEYYFCIDGKGEKIYYAHQVEKSTNNFDIFTFPMPMGARPDAITSLSGYLIDSITGKPLTGIIVAVDLDEGVEIEPKFLNKWGYFNFDLTNKKRYQLLVIGDDLIRLNEKEPLKTDTSFSAVAKSVSTGKPLVFESLEFDESKAEINPAVIKQLDYLVAFIKKNPYLSIKINGHTDSDGKDDFNLKLSEARADTIKAYIIRKTGIDPRKIVASGFGETRPLYPNDSKENKAKNRRVEFEIVIDEAYKVDYLKPVIKTDGPDNEEDTEEDEKEKNPESEDMDFSDLDSELADKLDRDEEENEADELVNEDEDADIEEDIQEDESIVIEPWLEEEEEDLLEDEE